MFQIDQLEIDRFDWRLVHCPLLKEPVDYVPDTVDLIQDVPARNYWLACFGEAIDKVISFFGEILKHILCARCPGIHIDLYFQFVERAIQSQIHHSDAHERAKIFKEKYLSRLEHLRTHPL